MKKILFIILLGFGLVVSGQSPQYSQYYASPLYLNPAFTSVSLGLRGNAIYRSQWNSISHRPFNTFSISADYAMDKIHSGVGILATKDKGGTSDLTYSNISALYSYNLHIHDKWVVLAGLQAGYTTFSLDYDELRFRSQFDPEDGFTGTSSGENVSGGARVGVPDFSTGLLAYDKDLWVGVSLHHLNRPTYSFGSSSSETLPIKLSVHSGVKIPITKGKFTNNERDMSITPSFMYKAQEKFDQLDLGLYVNYNPIVTGLWFRGLPLIKQHENIPNYDAVTVLIGYHQDGLTIGYTYDITISKLGGSSGGAHEISVGYEIAYPPKKKKKYEKFIPCPKF